jgi:hypothetical protein
MLLFTVTQSEQDRSCILLIRLQRRNGDWLWIHCVLQVHLSPSNRIFSHLIYLTLKFN